jgi:hypothetical protein
MRHTMLSLATILVGMPGCGGSGAAGDAGADAGPDSAPDAYVFVPGNHIADPMATPGGGLGSGAVDGELNVFVIDAATDEPIEGAEVRVGASDSATPLIGITDADGLFVFVQQGLAGAQTITGSADNHAAATWFGANGAVVTMPLAPTGTPPGPPTATVSGTIPNWEATLDPTDSVNLIAVILYSLANGENNIVDQGGTGGNVCVHFPTFGLTGPCEWTLVTRTGSLAIYAIVYFADNSGNFTGVRSYALKTGYGLAENDVVTGEDLPLIADSDLVTTQVAWGAMPTGLTDVQWIALLDLGDEGNAAMVDLAALPGDDTLLVPDLVGELASDSYRLVASAQANPADMRQSVIAHRTTAPDGTVDLGAWQALPQDVAATTGTYSFTAVAGATIHAVNFAANTDGTPVWNVLLLDGSTSFTLPALAPDPWPSGDVDMKVNAFDLPGFDPTEFALNNLTDIIEHTSADGVTFTPTTTPPADGGSD